MNNRKLNIELARIADKIISNPKANNFKCPIDLQSFLDFEIKSYQEYGKLEIILKCKSCDLHKIITINTN